MDPYTYTTVILHAWTDLPLIEFFMLYQKLASLSLDASAWIATPGRLVKHDKEAATVSVVCYDCTSLSILSEKTFSFEGEHILAADSGNSDLLAIVSGLKTNVKWTRCDLNPFLFCLLNCG